MAAGLPFRLVDAFADAPFTGNPAGVVLDADGLTDEQMIAIAREVHASETAFIFHANDLHRPTRIRWCTPTNEVGFCGHATLAAVHALHEAGCLDPLRSKDDGSVTLESRAGALCLHDEPLPESDVPLWWLRMPSVELRPDRTNPMKTCELLGMTIDDVDPAVPIMRTAEDDVLYVVKSWNRLATLQPNFFELKRWCEKHRIRGICVSTTATLSASVDVQSRFFAPACGIDEDPVTGSVHGPLAALLVINRRVPTAGGKAGLTCIQGEPAGRTGVVRVLVESRDDRFDVSIAGTCRTTVIGEMRRPADRGG